MILIKHASGEVISKVKRPTVLFDSEDGTLYKLGEYEEVKIHYDKCVSTYKDFGLDDHVETLVILELQKNQELVDKISRDIKCLKKMYDDGLI